MLHLLHIWLLSAVSLILAAYLLPQVEIADFGTALIAAALIGILNATLGWLLSLMVFPLTWLVPGLVYLVIDAIMIYVASRFIRGFVVRSFGAALPRRRPDSGPSVFPATLPKSREVEVVTQRSPKLASAPAPG